ncbi:MAG TPA: carboxypeptidase regulatory-like domain-containing protein [Verrucomicrobiae bacterium]|nr:carboxypeptidase regulatory-like domain-containing protein [Verrucomicrobiae bacterium]
MNRISPVGVILALIVALSGCSGSSGGTLPSAAVSSVAQTSSGAAPASATGTTGTKHASDTIGGGALGLVGGVLAILLGDAPPVIGNLNVTSVNLGIDAVNVVYQGQVTTLATYSTPYVVNVMSNGGQPSSIGIGQLYSGNYDHIQFVVDTATSNIVANGATMPINFQVGAQSQSSAGAGNGTSTTGNSTTITMTVGGAFMIGGNPAAAVMADFNAVESLNQNSQGQIVAVPTLYAVATANAGQVGGQILNANGQPVTNAIVVALNSRGHVANTVNTDANGNFDLHTINAGSYQLVIYNNYTTASGQNIVASGADASQGASFQGPTVTVTAGQTTQVGTLND